MSLFDKPDNASASFSYHSSVMRDSLDHIMEATTVIAQQLNEVTTVFIDDDIEDSAQAKILAKIGEIQNSLLLAELAFDGMNQHGFGLLEDDSA